MNKPKKYYTTGDIARYCEVDVNTVKSWIKQDSLAAFTTPAGHYRITRDIFIKFVRDQGFMYDPLFFGEDSDRPDILIIDDDPQHLELTVYQLEQSNTGMKIETAPNGFDGYMRLHQRAPRLVLLDLVMPGVAGLEFLRIMQSNNILNGIKVLVISGHLDDPTYQELKQLQVDAVLKKPVKREALLKKCDELLERVQV